MKTMEENNFLEDFNPTVDKAEIYLFHEYQLILRCNPSDKVMLHGIVSTHMEDCKNKKCFCVDIANQFMKIPHFKNFKNELAQILANNDDSSLANIIGGEIFDGEIGSTLREERSIPNQMKKSIVNGSIVSTARGSKFDVHLTIGALEGGANNIIVPANN